MKNKTYIIVSGNNREFLAQVSGPEAPALSTLYREFRRQYNIERKPTTEVLNAYDIMDQVTREATAITTLRREGLLADSLPESFILWLCRHHGFSTGDPDVFVTAFL